jgi:hypothetical protein
VKGINIPLSPSRIKCGTGSSKGDSESSGLYLRLSNSILLFLCIFVNSCGIMYTLPAVSVNVLPEQGDLQIREWQVAGPLPVKNQNIRPFNSGLDQDNLKNFGLSEEIITASNFSKIKRRNAGDKKSLPDHFRNKRIRTELDHLNLRSILPDDQPANAYLACILQCDKEREVAFLLGSDDGIKIWLNGSLLFRLNVKRKLHRYQNFVRAKLNKGDNFLLVKANHLRDDWRLLLNICSVDQGRREYKDYSTFDFLRESIVSQDDSLTIELDLFGDHQPAEITILDKIGELILKVKTTFSGKKNINLDALNRGLYTCMATLPADTFRQDFYYGDVQDALAGYRKRAGLFKTSRNDTPLSPPSRGEINSTRKNINRD